MHARDVAITFRCSTTFKVQEELCMAMGDDDKVEGKIDKAKGKMKKAWGEITDDKDRKAEGSVDKAKGTLKEIKGDIKRQIDPDKP